MSTEYIDDGGPAFPTTPVSHGYRPDTEGLGTGCGPGMMLRDWFAGQALAGMLANSWLTERYGAPLNTRAADAYEFADAMLKARKGKT